MNGDQKAARNYLIPLQDSFWQWRDGGDVLAWADGKTIAFRAEVQAVMQALAPEGLPSLGAVALLLAGCRDNWRETSSELGLLLGMQAFQKDGDTQRNLIAEVVNEFDRICLLPDVLKQSPQAKAALCQIVFQDAPVAVPAAWAAGVVTMLDARLPEDVLTPSGEWAHSLEGVLRDIKLLRAGLKRVDAETVRLRLKTGLDELPQPVPNDLAPAERVRALLTELDNDEELRGLARVARKLMAAVTLPHSLADREELPVGGVSDITNRGPLDRLLLSELAHDDMTLAVRVALNEALYLRRESPPRTPPRQRAVLLETGIRCWGVPRVFATAVALAMAATDHRNTEVVTYRARGNKVEPVDLTTREGLVAHLAVIEPDLHPGAALEAFQIEMAGLENAAEPVLVTTDDVMDDHSFLQALQDHYSAPLHVTTVNRAGAFRLLERTSRGSKLIREAELDLSDLFAAPQRVVPALIDKNAPPDLPAIFGITPFPLRLPHNIDPSRIWRVEGYGYLTVTRDRRLMLWSKAGQGAEQLSDTLPSGNLHWSTATPGDHIRAVVGQMQGRSLHRLNINLRERTCTHMPLDVCDESHKGVWGRGGVLYAIGKQHIDVIDLLSGDLIEKRALPAGMVWQRERFFRTPNGRWFVLTFHGAVDLQAIGDEHARRSPLLSTIFERHGVDDFMGVTWRGDLYSLATGNLRKVGHTFTDHVKVLAISPDGGKVVIAPAGGPSSQFLKRCVIDVDTLAVQERYGDPAMLVEPPRSVVQPLSIRNRATHICVDVQGVLTLITTKQQLALDYNSIHDRIGLRRNNSHGSYLERKLGFKPVATLGQRGYQLAVATWEDGSQAFLDSRGLLHLKSSDESIPETTIVLSDDAMSGWCSDGRVWGRPYFIGDQPAAPMRDVFNSCIKSFATRLHS